MRVTEIEARSMLCPQKLGYSMADKFCEADDCMAFKEIGPDVRFDEQGRDYTVTVYVCGLARLL